MDGSRTRFGLRTTLALVVTSFALPLNGTVAGAHPGGIDSRGGHHCYTNCSRWGEVQGAWHCHQGCGGGGGGGGGSSTPTPPRDTTPPRKPDIRRVTTEGRSVKILFVGEDGSTLNVWNDGRVLETLRANGDKQRVELRLQDGRHTIKLVLKDAAGNKSRPATRTVTIDATAPNKPRIDVDPPSSDGAASMISLDGEPRALYSIGIKGSDGSVFSDSGRLPASGVTTFEVELEDGEYVARARLRDQTGNKSPVRIHSFSVTAADTSAVKDEYEVVSSASANQSDDGRAGSAFGGLILVGGIAYLLRKRIVLAVERIRSR